MHGIIAWIRPDGRLSLVVVSGLSQMVSGDPGPAGAESLKVGDLVFIPQLNQGALAFDGGLQLVTSGYWPRIIQDIGAMSRASLAQVAAKAHNVVSIFAARRDQPQVAQGRRRALTAAE